MTSPKTIPIHTHKKYGRSLKRAKKDLENMFDELNKKYGNSCTLLTHLNAATDAICTVRVLLDDTLFQEHTPQDANQLKLFELIYYEKHEIQTHKAPT